MQDPTFVRLVGTPSVYIGNLPPKGFGSIYAAIAILTAGYVGFRHRRNLNKYDSKYRENPRYYHQTIIENMVFHGMTWPYFWFTAHEEGYVLPSSDRVYTDDNNDL